MSIWQNFIIVGDNHGELEERSATDAMFKFVKDWQPKYRIHLGDNWDFSPMRSKVGETEAHENIGGDFKAGMEFLEKFKPTHFLRGNHDERLWEFSHRKGMLGEYTRSLVVTAEDYLRKIKCPMLPYDKRLGVLQFGHLNVIHGYSHGLNAVRTAAQTYGSVVQGHIHSTQTAVIPALEYRVGRSIACLCELDPNYTLRTIGFLNHAHGFGYGIINTRTGEYQIWQAEGINGMFILPSETKIYETSERIYRKPADRSL
jgi:hypothetical protein